MAWGMGGTRINSNRATPLVVPRAAFKACRGPTQLTEPSRAALRGGRSTFLTRLHRTMGPRRAGGVPAASLARGGAPGDRRSMESLSAGLRGLGSMVARATTGGAGSGGDATPRPFALGPPGMVAAEWTDGGLQLWLIGADGTVEASHSAVGVGVRDLEQGQHFESVFEQQVRILEQQGSAAGRSDSHVGGAGLRPALVCGAAGGRGGWCETPCVGLPAGVKQLASAAMRVPTASGRVIFMVPGCEMRAGDRVAAALAEESSDIAASTGNSTARSPQRLDILRGQETLVMGTLITAVLHQQPGTVFRPEKLFCLLIDEPVSGAQSDSNPSAQHGAPSRRATQSAWISTKDGAINWFRSYRTGMACDALASVARYVLNRASADTSHRMLPPMTSFDCCALRV
eukprot:COSAG02_NODE_3983_length_5954_cov_60.916482_1_plen_401_part_00